MRGRHPTIGDANKTVAWETENVYTKLIKLARGQFQNGDLIIREQTNSLSVNIRGLRTLKQITLRPIILIPIFRHALSEYLRGLASRGIVQPAAANQEKSANLLSK